MDKPEGEIRILINTGTPVGYWCDLIGCEEHDLLQAMSVLGNSFDMVRDYLVLNRKINKA